MSFVFVFCVCLFFFGCVYLCLFLCVFFLAIFCVFLFGGVVGFCVGVVCVCVCGVCYPQIGGLRSDSGVGCRRKGRSATARMGKQGDENQFAYTDNTIVVSSQSHIYI